MRFTYCPDCGSKLALKEIGDEGLIPFCDNCSRPWFDIFPTCVITLVTDGAGSVVLLQQNYMSTQYKSLVSGYMKPGEDAHSAARREVKEEIGLTLSDLRLIRTVWFEKQGLLMIAFIGRAEHAGLTTSAEVDEAGWYPAEEAIRLVHPKSPGNASYMLVETYLQELEPGAPTS